MKESEESLDDSQEEREITSKLIGYLFGVGKRLRESLSLDATTHRFAVGSAQYSPSHYYMFSVLDIVDRALFAAARQNDELPTNDEMEEEKDIPNALLESWRDEQHLWTRKLTEILVMSIHFCSTKTFADNIVRHFLLLQEYSTLEKHRQELIEVYGCHSQNYQYSINYTNDEITRQESGLDLNEIWYLESKVKWELRKQGSKRKPFKSFFCLFRDSVKHQTAQEGFVLGFSYESCFGRPSAYIHGEVGGLRRDDVDWDELKGRVQRIILLAQATLLRCSELVPVENNDAEVLRKAIEKSSIKALLLPYQTQYLEVGDFASVMGGLCEITGVHTGPFGLLSYDVEFLSHPPIATVKYDSFPAAYVRRLKGWKKLVEGTLREFSAHFPDGPSPPDDILRTAVRQSMIANYPTLKAELKL